MSGGDYLNVFTCIRNYTHLDAAGKLLDQNDERHLKSEIAKCVRFSRICRRQWKTQRAWPSGITFSLENIGYKFPEYAVPAGHTMDWFLRDDRLVRCATALRRDPARVKRQIEKELALIRNSVSPAISSSCGTSSILPRKQHHGPGPRQRREQRGLLLPWHHCGRSGGKSLLFERFLSEGRKSWPDIDIDLPSGDRREQSSRKFIAVTANTARP